MLRLHKTADRPENSLAFLARLSYNLGSLIVFTAKSNNMLKPGTGKRWFLPLFIAVGLFGLLAILGGPDLVADTQSQSMAEWQSGISVFPVQLARDSFGMVMVDTINQTLWVYEFAARGPAHSQLKLWAARSWRYDRKLGQYNTAEPKPEQIKKIVLKELQQ
ncbi:MAG: hypothetical protein ACYSRZ_07910 [Planctomycetota bacterium]